jgi:hypothetical protein
MQQASFQVETRAGMLPSQNYLTAGEALKELVDNAWDADAEEVGRTSKKRRPIKGREGVGNLLVDVRCGRGKRAVLPVAKNREKNHLSKDR